MVIQDINRKAKAEAAEQIAELEKQRKAEEKQRMMKAVPEAEALQQKYIIAGCCCFIVLLIGAIISYTNTGNLIILLCLLFLAFFFTGFIFYVAYHAGIVLEEPIPEGELERALEERERMLVREKMTEYNTRRAKVKAAEKADREHRRKLRTERKEKEAIRKEIEEAERKEFLRLAKEEIANAKKAMKGKKKSNRPKSSEGGAVAAAAAAGLDITGLEDEEDPEDSDGYEGLFNDIEDVDAVHEIPMDDKLKKKRKRMPADPPVQEDTGEAKMQLNMCEITIMNIRPYISDNSSLYARAFKVTYHIPRGKRHRVGE